MARGSGAGRLLEESRAFVERRGIAAARDVLPRLGARGPGDRKGTTRLENGPARLLGLYPIVVLELRFLNPLLRGFNSSLATFIGNTLSVAGTTFITMPVFVRAFGWWLFLDKTSAKWATPAGLCILSGLFVVEVALFWRFF